MKIVFGQNIQPIKDNLPCSKHIHLKTSVFIVTWHNLLHALVWTMSISKICSVQLFIQVLFSSKTTTQLQMSHTTCFSTTANFKCNGFYIGQKVTFPVMLKLGSEIIWTKTLHIASAANNSPNNQMLLIIILRAKFGQVDSKETKFQYDTLLCRPSINTGDPHHTPAAAGTHPGGHGRCGRSAGGRLWRTGTAAADDPASR